MKKIFSMLVTLVISAILNGINAQGSSAAFNLTASENIYQYDSKASTEKDAAIISMKVLRDFAKSFKNVTNEKWYKVSDGYMASFSDNGIETKVAYDRKGVFHCTLRTLNESQLPADVRAIVKSKYYDFKILVAYEIIHDSDPVYIFKIEDNKTLKMLRVADGELEVITDNAKG
ncbi:MAG TPA: hypothetical protein VH396_22300 [Chitinophagaceae bacterium]|jgi:hypothetical protein